MDLQAQTAADRRSGCSRAAEAARFTYTANGIDSAAASIGDGLRRGGEAVFIPSLQRVECVIDDQVDMTTLLLSMKTFADAGWDVWALVPQALLGPAHSRFRNHAARIQGWWDQNDRINFSNPELP
jgi:hypothetical protein